MDEVTFFVKFFVVVALLFAPRLRWDNSLSLHLSDGFEDVLGVIRPVTQDKFALEIFEQRLGVRSFVRLSWGEQEPERVA